MNMTPTDGHVLITESLRSEQIAADVKRRSGLLVAKPDFEGIPNRGFVYALPADYVGELSVGMEVVINEQQPKGFKFSGERLLAVELEKVVGVINVSHPS